MITNPQANPLIAIRERIGWPQVTMAQEMGLSLRAYQALEAGETPMRRIHMLAAERVALYTAWMQMRPDFIKGQIARELIEIARDCYGLEIRPVGPDFLPNPHADAPPAATLKSPRVTVPELKWRRPSKARVTGG